VAVLGGAVVSQTQGVFSRERRGRRRGYGLQMIFRLLAVSGVIKLPIGIGGAAVSAGDWQQPGLLARFEFASALVKRSFGLAEKSVAALTGPSIWLRPHDVTSVKNTPENSSISMNKPMTCRLSSTRSPRSSFSTRSHSYLCGPS